MRAKLAATTQTGLARRARLLPKGPGPLFARGCLELRALLRFRFQDFARYVIGHDANLLHRSLKCISTDAKLCRPVPQLMIFMDINPRSVSGAFFRRVVCHVQPSG